MTPAPRHDAAGPAVHHSTTGTTHALAHDPARRAAIAAPSRPSPTGDPERRRRGRSTRYDFGFENPATGDNTRDDQRRRDGHVQLSARGGNFHNVDFNGGAADVVHADGRRARPVPPLPPIRAARAGLPRAGSTPPGTYAFVCGAHSYHDRDGRRAGRGDAHARRPRRRPRRPPTAPTPTATATPTRDRHGHADGHATATADAHADRDRPTPDADPDADPTADRDPDRRRQRDHDRRATTAHAASRPRLTPRPTPAAAAASSSVPRQRGQAVRGSLTVARAGSRVKVDVLAKPAALGRKGKAPIRVGSIDEDRRRGQRVVHRQRSTPPPRRPSSAAQARADGQDHRDAGQRRRRSPRRRR